MSASQRQDRQSLLLIATGAVLFACGIACWWLGGDAPLHAALRLTGQARDMVLFSSLGGLLVMGPVAVIACGLLLWRRRAADALWLFLTIALGRLAVEGVKLVIMRPRPPQVDWLEIVNSWSFPSSHSAGTMMTCVALALLTRTHWGMPAALVTAALIGWSRVALAVHWPSDVLGGWGFGLMWLGVSRSIQTAVIDQPDPLRDGHPDQFDRQNFSRVD